SEYVLALVALRDTSAWCWKRGLWVFRNDPAVVAAAFMTHLRHRAWADRFERIVFSVLDSSPSREALSTFQALVLAATLRDDPPAFALTSCQSGLGDGNPWSAD